MIKHVVFGQSCIVMYYMYAYMHTHTYMPGGRRIIIFVYRSMTNLINIIFFV